MKYTLLLVTSLLLIFLPSCKSHEKADKFRNDALELGKKNDYAGEIELLEKALSYEENNYTNMSSWDSTLINWTYMEWASDKFKKKDIHGAIDIYNTIIKRDKYYSPAYLNRSYCLQEIDNLQGALNDAENYLAAIRYNSFSNTYEKALQGWQRRGDINFALGRYEDFLSDYEKAIEYTTQDTSKAKLYTTMAGNALIKMKNGEKTLMYSDLALKYDSTLGRPFLFKAIVYKNSGMKSEACDAIRKAVKFSKDHSIKDIKDYCE